MNRDATTIDVEASCTAASTPRRELALEPIATTDGRLEYCLALARNNMNPYLERRGQKFDDIRWRNCAPCASFYLIVDRVDSSQPILGFVSVRDEPDTPTALHIGDIQLEARHRNRGVGKTVLELVDTMVRLRGLKEITLNVFRDNPAQRLYERSGFRKIDMQFDKFKMRKTL